MSKIIDIIIFWHVKKDNSHSKKLPFSKMFASKKTKIALKLLNSINPYQASSISLSGITDAALTTFPYNFHLHVEFEKVYALRIQMLTML
ncbi:hypothetical protein P615_24220 [Brevibacillus laterosporus PE36]|nr:hypothetical protein P615_24220 [Brevibacillus laterosporus PE36]